MLHGVFQLADIAGKPVGLDKIQGFPGNFGHRTSQLLGLEA
jgi:hypothetical protein